MSWRGLDHRSIYEMVVHGGQGPGVSMDAEQQWLQIQKVISEAEHGIATAMRASESGWEGTGADTTRSAYTPLGAWALNAAVSAHVTATGVRGQADLAMNTRMHVAENAPPQNFLEHLHDQVGSWDGHTVYDEQAAAVDRLMGDYEVASEQNVSRFDSWSVPPTIVVSAASAESSTGSGGASAGAAGVGAMSDTGGLAPTGGAGGAPVGGAGAQAPSAGGAGGSLAGAAGSGGAGVGGGGGGVSGVGAPGGGAAVPVGAGARPGAGPGGAAGPGRVAPGAGAAGVGGVGTGGVTRPSDRPPGSPGGSGRGMGPWSRAAAEAGRPAGSGVGGGFRPVVPGVPPRTSTPDWRSVLVRPESVPRDGAAGRPGGESAARPAGPGGSTTAAAQGAGTRGTAGGVYPPMAGGGGGGQPEGRTRPSYLIDDSDAFVDRRWVSPAVIAADDSF